MNKKPTSYGSMASTSDVQFSGNGSSSEINNLCDSIVTNIYTVNQSWKTLDSCYKTLGTKRDNQGLRDKITVTQQSTNQIISVTSRNIQRLTMLVRKGEKQQKLQVEKLTENFKEAVGRYFALQTDVADKMKSNLLVVVSIENEGVEPRPEQQEQMRIAREMEFEQEMLLDRQQKIAEIESNIIDINQIMRDLNTYVNQQGETVNNVENAVEHATGNIEEGNAEVMKAARYQNKYRRKLCYLVIIGSVIALILIIVLVTELKKK